MDYRLNTNKMPAHSFSLVTPFYDQLSRLVFGPAIYRSQEMHIHLIPAGARVLLIGGGTGKLLPALMEQTRCREVVFLEASDKMLAKAREQVAGQGYASSIIFRLGTEEDIAPEDKFDVVLTHFFLDLFAPAALNKIISRLHQALLPGGWWLVSDFVRPGGSRLRGALATALFSSMYLFFRLTCGISATTLPNWEDLLAHFHLKSIKSAYFYHGLIKATAYQKV
jgi:tRNA (cmo5U34)-methyltransferase